MENGADILQNSLEGFLMIKWKVLWLRNYTTPRKNENICLQKFVHEYS